jgi:hypothetical protein
MTRVLILLIIFAPQLYETLSGRSCIAGLVRIACKAIQLAYEPPHAWHLARYYRAEEVQRLQTVLRLELDRDRNGTVEGPEEARAREAGLDPAQIRQPVLEADLTQLIAAARLLQLVPESYTEQQVRQRAWDVAAAESQRFFEPYDRKIESLLDTRFRWPDYTRWETWETGLVRFVDGLYWLWLLLMGALSAMLVAEVVSLGAPRGRPFVGLAVGCGMVIVPVAVWGPPTSQEGWLLCLGFLLLAGTMGYVGGKAAARVKRRLFTAMLATFISGGTLIACGAWPLVRLGEATSALIAGLLLVTVGIAGLWLGSRKAKARTP